MNPHTQDIPDIPDTLAKAIRREARFGGIFPEGGRFERRITLSSPVYHGDESEVVGRAPEKGFDGPEVLALEEEIAAYTGRKYVVALSSGRAALHKALKLAAKRLYADEDFDTGNVSDPANCARKEKRHTGCLSGLRVFCQDFAPASVAEAVLREDGEPVFVDVSYEDWSMDPKALERAFSVYPDVRIVIMYHTYGFTGQAVEIKRICEAHGALLIEDASESFGASCFSAKTGTIGDYGIFDFGKGRIITGDGGGMLLLNEESDYRKAGYDYGMNDLTAARIRAQLTHLDEHIEKKRAIYNRYFDAFEADGLLCMNPSGEGMEPNYGMSCAVCECGYLSDEDPGEYRYDDVDNHGMTSPMEICNVLSAFGAEACPVYRPLSMQKDYRSCDLITAGGSRRSWEPVDRDGIWSPESVGCELYHTAVCLPGDPGMTREEQDTIIEIIRSCFNEKSFPRTAWREGLEKIS